MFLISSHCLEKFKFRAKNILFNFLNRAHLQNRVSVFSGPYRSNETVEKITKKKARTPPLVAPPPDDRADKLAEMMGRVFSELIGGRDLAKIKVNLSNVKIDKNKVSGGNQHENVIQVIMITRRDQ